MEIKEISPVEVKAWLDSDNKNSPFLLDVREPSEHETAKVEGFTLIPMHSVPNNLSSIPDNQPIICMCHHGGRSMKVAQFLREQYSDREIYNLTGGIDAWSLTIDPSITRY